MSAPPAAVAPGRHGGRWIAFDVKGANEFPRIAVAADLRLWYAGKALEHRWSQPILVHQIETRLHEPQGKAVTNSSWTLPAPQSDRPLMRDGAVQATGIANRNITRATWTLQKALDKLTADGFLKRYDTVAQQ